MPGDCNLMHKSDTRTTQDELKIRIHMTLHKLSLSSWIHCSESWKLREKLQKKGTPQQESQMQTTNYHRTWHDKFQCKSTDMNASDKCPTKWNISTQQPKQIVKITDMRVNWLSHDGTLWSEPSSNKELPLKLSHPSQRDVNWHAMSWLPKHVWTSHNKACQTDKTKAVSDIISYAVLWTIKGGSARTRRDYALRKTTTSKQWTNIP